MTSGEDAIAPPAGLGALEAQRLLDLIALKTAPAAVGGAITYLHTGEGGYAVLSAISMLAAARLLEPRAMPMALMPASRVVVGLAGPVIGLSAAALAVLAAGRRVGIGQLESAVIGAWLTIALGAWVSGRFSADSRVRIGVIGSHGLAAQLAAELDAAGIRSHEIVGWFGPRSGEPGRTGPGWLGELGALRAEVVENQIDLLICEPVPIREPSADAYSRIAAACLDLRVRVIDANQLYEDLLGHVPLGTVDSAWFRYLVHPRFRPPSPLSKRVFDLAVVAALGVVALPVIGVAALAIAIFDGAPVLYRQRRVGEQGRVFEILKLRTMVADAEETGPRWCEPDDARVTSLGRVLRRLHVDELPQLLNVLKGEMTLVGPRPERPEMVGALERRFPHYERRHLVKPGVTGWAQLRCGYAGSELGTAWKLCHDLFYVKHRSILADSLILVETGVAAGRDTHRAMEAPSEGAVARAVGDWS